MLKLAAVTLLCFCLCSLMLFPASIADSGVGDAEDDDNHNNEYDDDYEHETAEEEYNDYDEDYQYDPFGCEAGDLCKGANRSKESLLRPSDMSSVTYWSTACFCDADCWRYGDCCADVEVTENDKTQRKIDWRCDLLPGYGEYIYVIGSCPHSWKDGQVAAFCERSVTEENYNYLLDIPVFSNATKKAYSNVFCATCHREVGLSPIRLNLLCPFHLPSCSDHLRRGHYIPGRLTWHLEEPHLVNYTLTLTVDYFKDWDNLKSYSRRCWPVVDSCPGDRPDDLYGQFCLKNVSYVRTVFPHKTVKYKNIDCALCNDVNPTLIECVSDPHPDYSYTSLLPFRPSQPVVGLHYSWDMEFRDPIEISGWHFRCGEGDLFHPVYNICVPFLCGKNFVRIRDNCVNVRSSNAERDSGGCKMLAVNKEDVTVLEHNSIYVGKTRTTFHKDEFEEHDNFSYLVCDFSESSSYVDNAPPISSCSQVIANVTILLLACMMLLCASIHKNLM